MKSGAQPTPEVYRLAWDSSPAHPRARSAVPLVLGLLVLPLGLVWTGLRIIPPRDDVPALLASFIPYAVIPYAVALMLVLIALVLARRRKPLAVLAAAITVLLTMHLTWLAPLFVRNAEPVSGGMFTVLSLNIRAESADPVELAAEAEQADIVVLVEASPSAVAAAVGAGLQESHPYVVGETVYGRTGSAIYSRFPLGDAEPLPASRFPQWAVTVAVPDVGDVRVFAVHPCNPFCGPGLWPAEHEFLAEAVAPSADGPTIVAGDFNAVHDHRPMRRLRDLGMRDAADLAGAGWLPTYPANSRLPPLIPIDHVLVGPSLTALSVETVRVTGTDHLGLLATLAER